MKELIYEGLAEGLYSHKLFTYFMDSVMKLKQANVVKNCLTSHCHEWLSKKGALVKYSIRYKMQEAPEGVVNSDTGLELDYRSPEVPEVTVEVEGPDKARRTIRVFSKLQSLVIDQIIEEDLSGLEDRVLEKIMRGRPLGEGFS